MHTVELESFPPGSNPFLEDAISCGSSLKHATTNAKLKDVYVMSSGMNSAYDFYIVDSETGERIGIKLTRDETYDQEVPEYGDLLTVQGFRLAVKDGNFIDYDGFGYPVKSIDGTLKAGRTRINPSTTEKTLPSDATHVVWFNK